MAEPIAEDLLRTLADMVRKHGSVSAAARVLGISRTTAQHRWSEARRRLGLAAVRPVPVGAVPLEPSEPGDPVGLPFERCWDVWRQYVGMLSDRYGGPAASREPAARVRVVAAGDFHCPYHDTDALARLISAEGGRADVCVIGGDLIDAEAASTFTPRGRVARFEEEYAAATFVLERLSEVFPRVLYLKRSNHPDRYEKRIRERLPAEVVEAVLEMTGGVLSPDLAIVRRFPNVEVASWRRRDGLEVGWLAVLGDVAFSHAQKHSRIPGGALRGVHEWLSDFDRTLDLPVLRALIQFHTHTQAVIPWRGDAVLVEAGAMCLTPSYSVGDRVAGRPQRTGYAAFELEAGRLVMETLRVRWIDEERRHEGHVRRG